jgi:hypothetical protein
MYSAAYRLFVALVAVAALLPVSGCIHARAKSAEVMPPLDVPAPPPRIVQTSDAEAPPPIGLIQEPERNLPPAVARPASPPPAKPEAPKTEAPKPETPVADAPKPPEEAPRPPAATLQTTPAQQEGEVEAKIRGVLSRATADLSRIDYAKLNTNAKSQYDSAKRFISLSEEALRAKNLIYAGTLADKSAELAAQLLGR